VTAASSIPVASASRVGSTAESLRNVDELGQEAMEMARMGRSSHSTYFLREIVKINVYIGEQNYNYCRTVQILLFSLCVIQLQKLLLVIRRKLL
jgi:hypothetical protein